MWDAELLYRELPATRGAGIPEVWVSAKGRATGFSSHPLSYDKGEFPAGAVNRAVSSHDGPVRPGPGRCQWRRRRVIPVENGYHEVRAHADSGDVVAVR